MRTRLLLRIGAACGALAFAENIFAQVYITHQAQLPANVPKSVDAQAQEFLVFLHHHPGWLAAQTALSAVSSLLLLGVAPGVFVFLRLLGARLARATLIVGLLSAVVPAATAIYSFMHISSLADRYASAPNVAAAHLVVTEASHPSVLYQAAGSLGFGLFGGVLWLGLIGVELIRVQGNRSLLGWVTIVAAILTIIPVVPGLALWCAGAAYMLYRASRNAGTDSATLPAAEEYMAPAPRAPSERKPRPSPAPSGASLERSVPSATLVEAMTPARPPRGTSERRSQPAAARGSKSGRAKKRGSSDRRR